MLISIGFAFGQELNIEIKSEQADKPISLVDYNKKVATKDKIILVYFSAEWCAVCAKMKTIIADIQNKDSAKVEIFKIDTDRDKQVANEFEIDALPVLMLYKNGFREWVNIGLIDKQELRYTLDYFLKQK